MHGNMLTVNGRKMAKSEGNGFTPEELISGNHALLERGYSPMTVRFFMLQGHYASTLDFSNEALQAAEKGLDRLEKRHGRFGRTAYSFGCAEMQTWTRLPWPSDAAAMGDDFNTPILIVTLFDAVKLVNSIATDRIAIDATQKTALVELLNGYVFDVLGLVQRKHEASGGNEVSRARCSISLWNCAGTPKPTRIGARLMRSVMPLVPWAFPSRTAKTAVPGTRGTSVFLLGLAALLLVHCGSEPTAPRSTPGDRNPKARIAAPAFDADSAYAYIAQQVAFGPRVPNTPEHVACGDWLSSELTRHGADVIEQPGLVRAYDGTILRIRNFIGQFRPENRERILLFRSLGHAPLRR